MTEQGSHWSGDAEVSLPREGPSGPGALTVLELVGVLRELLSAQFEVKDYEAWAMYSVESERLGKDWQPYIDHDGKRIFL